MKKKSAYDHSEKKKKLADVKKKKKIVLKFVI